MGYYTNHLVTCSDNPHDDLVGERLDALIEISGYSNCHFDGSESCKWYEHAEDLCKLSALYPNDTFRVEGSGEGAFDVWVEWYRDGKCIGEWYPPELKIPLGFTPPEQTA